MRRGVAGGWRGVGWVMIWRWFQDWRDRRAALTELRAVTRRREAQLLDLESNPLRRAADFISRNNFAEAAAQWDLARTLLPNAILESAESLDILCGLKRYDEAEALMRERQKRFPRDRFTLEGLARISESRGDLEEAVERWRAFSDRAREQANGYYGCARCLFALGRLDEAEHESDRSIRRGPGDLDGWVVRGLVSDRRGDWEESIRRWKKLTETHQFKPGFARAANAMIKLGRIDEAEAYLEGPGRLYGDDLEIALMRAHVARQRGNLTAACERWAVVRRGNPYFPAAYYDGARCLLDAGRPDEADAILREAMERFPGEAWPAREYAKLAHARGDPREAAIRWTSLHAQFPDEDAGFIPDETALNAPGGEAGSGEQRCG
jgi:tetratricopeptide (TPR) repeat protein